MALTGHGIPDGGARCDNRATAAMIEALGGGKIGLGMPLVLGSSAAPPVPLRVSATAHAMGAEQPGSARRRYAAI